MRSFDYQKLAQQKWDSEILSYVAKIHEYKGRQDLYIRKKPVELERLVEIARVQSTEASNKIEGIVTTSSRIRQLMSDKTTPRTRDEKEIMGYRDVLNTIHESYEFIPLRPSYILQLHRDLLKRKIISVKLGQTERSSHGSCRLPHMKHRLRWKRFVTATQTHAHWKLLIH